MHINTVKEGMKVLVHDDLLATGGTAAAASELIMKERGEVAGFSFLVELAFLEGKEKLSAYSDVVNSIITY
jgi:adenine phosphoribosyltransferase